MVVERKNYSPDELCALLANFDTTQHKIEFSRLTSGFINETFLVSSEKKPKYVLQRINDTIFKDVAGLMNNCVKALKQLKANNYSAIELVSTKTGEPYYYGPEGSWRLMSYITGSITFDTTCSTEIAFEAGHIIGLFHNLLEQESPISYVETIPNFHSLPLRVDQFEHAFSNASGKKLKDYEATITFVKETIIWLKENKIENIPHRICHNDTKLNNILFSESTKKAQCLIDLDTVMQGYFMFDFGDAVRTIVNPAREDEQQLSLIDFRTDFFEAFVQGLAETKNLWTATELKSLPYGVVLMPFLHGLRAFTDYLQGNIYYKVFYEKQNYDRALSLFEFAKKALKHVQFMDDTIANIFGTDTTC